MVFHLGQQHCFEHRHLSGHGVDRPVDDPRRFDETRIGAFGRPRRRADVHRISAAALDHVFEQGDVSFRLSQERFVAFTVLGIRRPAGDRAVEMDAATFVGQAGTQQVGDERSVQAGVGQ